MRGKLVKVIRKVLLSKGVAISALPYTKLENGQVISSDGRRQYQRLKKGS